MVTQRETLDLAHLLLPLLPHDLRNVLGSLADGSNQRVKLFHLQIGWRIVDDFVNDALVGLLRLDFGHQFSPTRFAKIRSRSNHFITMPRSVMGAQGV